MAITRISTNRVADAAITQQKLALKAVASTNLDDGSLVGGAQFANVVDMNGKAFSGSATFQAALSVADATATAHAVNKGQLDAAVTNLQNSISSLGNALNYAGTVSGGADAANAFDLASLTQKDVGDTYKVIVSGHFKVGANPAFFANANDHFVWNPSNTVDHFDHTNSTVAGTADFISVTGTADTGYQLDLDLAFKTRMTDAETKIGTVALTTTAANLSEAVNEHESDLIAIDSRVLALENTDITSRYRYETPTGAVDGSNKVFMLAEAPLAVTVRVYFDGMLQDPSEDYVLSGSTITTTEAQAAGVKVRAQYFKA